METDAPDLLSDNKLFYKGRLVIPRNSKLKYLLLTDYHCSLVGGTCRGCKDISMDGNQMVLGWDEEGCGCLCANLWSLSACQQQILSQQSPAGLLQPHCHSVPGMGGHIDGFYWGATDFLDTILVVDWLSKYAHNIGGMLAETLSRKWYVCTVFQPPLSRIVTGYS